MTMETTELMAALAVARDKLQLAIDLVQVMEHPRYEDRLAIARPAVNLLIGETIDELTAIGDNRCDSVNPSGGTATCSKNAGHDGDHMNRGGVWQ